MKEVNGSVETVVQLLFAAGNLIAGPRMKTQPANHRAPMKRKRRKGAQGLFIWPVTLRLENKTTAWLIILLFLTGLILMEQESYPSTSWCGRPIAPQRRENR